MNTILSIYVIEDVKEDVEIASHSNTMKVQSSTDESIKQGDDSDWEKGKISDCLEEKTEVSVIATGKLK